MQISHDRSGQFFRKKSEIAGTLGLLAMLQVTYSTDDKTRAYGTHPITSAIKVLIHDTTRVHCKLSTTSGVNNLE